VKIAYHFMVHADPAQFSWAFNALYNPDDYFSVHINASTPPDVAASLAEVAGTNANVHATRRVGVRWGGWSMCRAYLVGMEEMLRRHKDWSFFIALSGADYPLKAPDEIRTFLQENHGKNFVSAVPIADLEEPHFHSRSMKMHFEFGSRVRSFRIPYLRRPPYPFHLLGSGWHVLTREFCEWILTDPVARRCMSYTRFVYIPSEMWMQYLIENSPFKSTWINSDLREVLWEKGQSNPVTLTSRHRDVLENSPALFARKFDRNVDLDILYLLARRIGASSGR
jgi:hypothetical protein